MKIEDIFNHQIGSSMWDIENRKLNVCFSCLFEKVSCLFEKVSARHTKLGRAIN